MGKEEGREENRQRTGKEEKGGRRNRARAIGRHKKVISDLVESKH